MGNKSVKLGNVADVRDGTHDSPSYQDKGFPLVTTRCFSGTSLDMTQAKSISKADYDAINTRSRVDQYDILVSMIGTVGIVYQETDTEIKYAIKNVGLIKCHGNAVLSDWIYYWLNSNMGQQVILERLHGTTQKFISLTDLRNLPLGELPSQSVMKTRTDALKQLDAKIKLNQQINKNLLRLAKQQFNLTFPNVHEGNSRLSDVMENFDRKRIPLARREREKRQGVYRYVGATSVLDYVDDYLFDGTYLLMGEDGTVQDEKGFPILQYIWGKFWPNNHTHVLSGTFVSTEWLYLFLMNTNVRSRITGAVQQKISQANMNSIPLTIPSKDELFRFQKQIEPVFSQIQLLDEQNLKLTAIHKLLLPKLLAGQIDLSNLEGAIQNA